MLDWYEACVTMESLAPLLGISLRGLITSDETVVLGYLIPIVKDLYQVLMPLM